MTADIPAWMLAGLLAIVFIANLGHIVMDIKEMREGKNDE